MGYHDQVLANNPTLYWRFDENSGTTALDLSGHNNTGTYGSAIRLQADGPLPSGNTAAQFDGTGSATVLDSSYSPFGVGTQRTFMGWGYLTDSSTNRGILGDSTAAAAAYVANGGSNFVFRTTSTTSVTWSSAWPGLNQWVHWTITYNDSTKVAELFINGVSKGQQTLGAGVAGNTGFLVGPGFPPWKGILDEIAVFPSILSSSTISTIYQSGLGQPSLKVEVCFNADPFPTYFNNVDGIATGYWRLGEASGNFADSTGNGFTATATGGGFTYAQTGALPGDTDKAATFGTTSYATTTLAPTTAQLSLGFSIEAWVKRNGAPAASGAVFGAISTLQFYINTSGQPVIKYFDAGANSYTCTSNKNVCDNAYHHIVGIWNTAELWIFVDGLLACTPVVATTAAAGNANGLTIGAWNDGSSKLGSATLDEVAFYETALTPLQVQNHYLAKDVTTSPTWVDISSDVMAATIAYGEQYERQQTEAGSATLTIDNVAGNYDPANPNSPYYPNVIPLRRIRISANYAGHTYWLFHGYVERWPQIWEAPEWSEVQITCVDGFEFLTQNFLDGWIAQGKSGVQIDKALDIAGWSQASRNVNSGGGGNPNNNQGVFTLAAQQFWPYMGNSETDTDGLSFIQNCASSERGVFFIYPGAVDSVNPSDGIATYQDNGYRTTQTVSTVSQATFGDSDYGTGELPYTQLVASHDKDRIINDARVTIYDGVTTEISQDTTSIRKFFRRAYTLQTQLTNAADGLTYAQYLTNTYAEPSERFDQLTVQPLNDYNTWIQALTRTISDRITVNRRPRGEGGTGLSQQVYIEHISWNIPAGGEPWEVTWQTSPISSATITAAMILDTGKLDTNSLGF